MLIIILAGILLAFAAPQLHHWLGKYTYLPFTLFAAAVFAYLGTYLPGILQGHTYSYGYNWTPSLNINIDFYFDGLSLLFSFLISGFGVLIMIYAGGYLKGDPLLGRFYLYLTLFMVAMLGVVLSGNIFSLFIFWELTSISSYMLIGFKNEKKEARDAALQALLVTGSGGLALMAGLLLLGIAGGSFTLTDLLARGDLVRSSELYIPALVLVLAGAFTKSAQFPFHFWLPNAMEAPTPVSAYLHSATMVKAGIYLLARLSPVMGGTEAWQYSLMAVGGFTAVFGAFMAMQHTDLKAILAYTTISALGLLVTLTGIGAAPALQAMLVFLLAHALYKGTLFLVAGNVDHATGTRDLNQLQGLGKKMWRTGAAATMAALSMAGVLPFFGFIGKELLYKAALEAEAFGYLLLAVFFVAGLVFVTVAFVLGYGLFWKKSEHATPVVHHLALSLYLPPVLLATAGLAFGLLPGIMATPLLQRAAQAILVEEQTFKLVLWHGFNLVLGLSLLTLVAGYVVFLYSIRLRSFAPFVDKVHRFGPNYLYKLSIVWLLYGATRITALIQNGYLRNYIMVIILTLMTLVTMALWNGEPALEISSRVYQLRDVRIHEIILVLLIFPALAFLLLTGSRLTSIAIMGMIGYTVALFYILFGAPDVAATQLLIETLTVVLFVLILHKMPAFRKIITSYQRIRYMIVSAIFGGMMTYVMLLVKQFPIKSELKRYYGENAYLLGKGHNIVNVILVDFRALDTLGEITVLAVAAIGIFAVLKLHMGKGDSS